MTKNLEHPEWFFYWSNGDPYITSICEWTRKDLIEKTECILGVTWKKIYQLGGRAVRVKMVLQGK